MLLDGCVGSIEVTGVEVMTTKEKWEREKEEHKSEKKKGRKEEEENKEGKGRKGSVLLQYKRLAIIHSPQHTIEHVETLHDGRRTQLSKQQLTLWGHTRHSSHVASRAHTAI